MSGGAAVPLLLLLLSSLLCSVPHALADDGDDDPDLWPTATTLTNAPPPNNAGATKVVSIFYIDERAYEGLPYTLFHRDSGSVIGVDADHTTFVITTTRVDQRPSPTHSRTDNITTGIPTLRSKPTHHPNATGQPSTITQGPATFIFTGTRYGADNTLINQCSLNGTVSAVCNLTHVGSAWYTGDPSWNGTYSTYSYNWTSGARWGFAPVTITMGAELMQGLSPTASRTANAAAAPAGRRGPASEGDYFLVGGLAITAAAMALGAILVL